MALLEDVRGEEALAQIEIGLKLGAGRYPFAEPKSFDIKSLTNTESGL